MLNFQLLTVLENQIDSSGMSYVNYLYASVLFTFLFFLSLRYGGGLAKIMGVP